MQAMGPIDEEKTQAALDRLSAAYAALEEAIEPFRRAMGGGDPVSELEAYLRIAAQTELSDAYADYARFIYP